MRKYETVIQETQVQSGIVCDVCKKEYTDSMETQEFLHYADTGGYASVFGDMNVLKLDMCQHCVKDILGEYLQVS